MSKSYFFLSDQGPLRYSVLKEVGNNVFLEANSDVQPMTDVDETPAAVEVNAPNHDENVIKDCGYFWDLNAQQIEKKIIGDGDYCGHVDCWKYANSKGGITPMALKHLDNYLICRTAKLGHFDVLKYLCESEFGGEKLTIADIRSQDNIALRWAAHNGHLDVVKYLCESEFGGEKLTIADIRSKDNQALRWAAQYGHLDVVKYISVNYL